MATTKRSAAAPTDAPEPAPTSTAGDTDAAATAASGDPTPIRPDVTGFVDGGAATAGAVSLADIVDDDPATTIVTVKRDVYEEFTYPGSNRKGRRLLYHKGQRVPRAELDRRTAALAAATEDKKGLATEVK